jgi:DNA-binding NarL/FixJ family response regulator
MFGMERPVVRVLVVDDHPVVRGGLVALIRTLAGIEVVGEAADGDTAMKEAILTRPDVVILDLRMPGMDGVSVCRRLVADLPGIAVLVLTMFDDRELVAQALDAGARGYLVKGAEGDEIESAVRAVAAGNAILSSRVATEVLGRASRDRPLHELASLTAREREVLDLIARGLANGTIASRLSISPKTVGNHISAIFGKLGVSTRAEAIVVGRDSGYGT